MASVNKTEATTTPMNVAHSPAPVVWKAGKNENPTIRITASSSLVPIATHGLRRAGARLRTGAGMSVGVPHRKHTMALSAIVVLHCRQVMLAPYTTGRPARTMFPLGDVIPSRTTPWVTYGLVGVGVCFFAAGRLSIGLGTNAWPLLLSPFMNRGWAMFVANLLCLWIFGDNVEDRFGHGRFLLFYLAAAAAAGAVQVLWCGAVGPTAASSGAIAAIMAAYFVLFPYSRVLVGVFLIVVVDVIELPALFVVLLWTAVTFAPPAADLAPGAGRGAMCALGAGIAIGVIGARALRRPERQRVDWWS